ncbi:hypothetical protein FIU94_11610 [Sulfitobacter sp. THAF37]|uniref:heme-dependent oxidative N-demethylase family protein n=1 Tax=Sulfitobacter sp. THAF37 TaxID=2587855 RepID=UPI001269346D|nr:DUF3445 domain-containing protein [Sulfitobacter sp. THAF37]QFT59471.1 hypothetical protein FIU94_11610 [Sulfitobacter sp. THAF37]
MKEILHSCLPPEMSQDRPLPGVAPCGATDWLRVDETYSAQMAYRAALLAERPDKVLWEPPEARAAATEVLEEALALLPGLGFSVEGNRVICPDGRRVVLDWEAPLRTLGHLVQQDICVMDKRGDEHVLVAAVLCFPASWRLADKAGRPLVAIHAPVAEYDAGLARRVQRLFDGVQPGRPLWRFNRLPYADSDLHHPTRADPTAPCRYLRAERQCVVRMPRSRAVAFTIHTHVVRRAG